MATLEEEIRRRSAEDALSALSLLDAPEAQAESDSAKTTTSDWRKWPRSEPDQIPEGHIDLRPSETPLQIPVPTPESPAGPTNVRTDIETGTPYVEDPVTGAKIPRAELATPAEKEAFTPADVTLPQETVTAIQPEAPDKLTQVERATLVQFPKGEPATMPWHPAGQKPVPGFIEGSQNAILNPATVMPTVRRAELVNPDSDAQYLDPEVRRAVLAGQTPKAYLAAPPTGPKEPGTHTELAPPGQMDLRPNELEAAKPVVAAPADQPAQPTRPIDPNNWKTWVRADGTQPPPAKPEVTLSTTPPMNAPNGQLPAALIIHHTSGRGSAANVVDGWRTEHPGIGSQYIMDRDGVIHDTRGEFGYGGTGHFRHSVIPGVSNQTAVGIEVIAKDDADMTDAQIESLKRFAGPGGQYANVPVYGHSQVSPGDRDNEGVRGVNAITDARKAGGTTTDSSQVIEQLKASGINVTHYAYTGDPNLDAESAAGHGKYVDQMVAGYDVALNAAAAHLVGDPQPGETFRYAGRTWRYGDKVPEKYSDARFDIFDPYNTALSGGPLGGQTAEAKPKHEWESWARASPAEQQQATQAQQEQFKLLDSINQNTPNKGAFWKILNSGVPGVSEQVKQEYRDQFQKQVTDYALEYYKPHYPNITPEEAFKKATGDADFGTLIGEVGTKIIPNLTHAAIAMERSQGNIDENRINQFLSAINPNMSPEGRVEFKRSMMAMSPAERAAHINEGLAHMDPGVVAAFNPADIADSFDRISDPVYQAKRKSALDLAVAKNQHDLQTDPRLVNTPAEGVTQFLASAPKNISEMLTPVIGQSAMLSEIYTDTADQIRKEHPDWSEDDIKAKAGASTVAQVGPQVIISLMTGGVLSAATKGITQPLMELGARLGLHSTAAGVAGGLQKMLQNSVEGHPLMEGVQEAVISNAPYGLFGGAMAGRPEAKPIEAPVPQIEYLTRDQRNERLGLKPVTREETVGANVPEPSPLTATSLGTEARRYETGPIVTRGVERTTFTPSELAEQVSTLTGRTPEELRAAAEKMTPPTDFNQRAVWFLDEGIPEVPQVKKAQVPSPPPTLAEAIRQQKRAAVATRLGGPETVKPQGTVKPQEVVTFTTAKGSNYVVHDDGTTTRNKAYRPEHGVAEQGLQERSHRTIYITPGDAQKLGEIQAQGGPASNLVQASNGQWGLRYREGKDQGKFERRTMVNHTDVPAKGLIPVEIWDNGRRVHFGNEITEVKRTGKPQEVAVPPPRVSEADPYTSRIANRYTAERMATGELGHIDPSEGKSTEEMVMQGLKMSPQQRETLIDNFTKGKGGDLDQQGAAIRSKEALLSMQSKDASRAAAADPTNAQLQAQAKAAHDAVTAFHNGSIKKFKKVWSDAGRGLQREIPLDYTTLNGMKEAYLKGKGKEVPPEFEPQLKQMSDKVSKIANDEQEKINNYHKEVGDYIEKQTRGKPPLPSDDQVRTRLMEIMKDLPCRT